MSESDLKSMMSEEEFDALTDDAKSKLKDNVIAAIHSTQECVTELNGVLGQAYVSLGDFDFQVLLENFKRLDDIDYEELLTPENLESYRIARLLVSTGSEIQEKLDVVMAAFAKRSGALN